MKTTTEWFNEGREAKGWLSYRLFDKEGILKIQDDARKEYWELLFAVASCHPDETRHQTALRYINERENPSNSQPAQCTP